MIQDRKFEVLSIIPLLVVFAAFLSTCKGEGRSPTLSVMDGVLATEEAFQVTVLGECSKNLPMNLRGQSFTCEREE